MKYGRTGRLTSQKSVFKCKSAFQEKLSSEETEDEEDDVERESEDVLFAQDYLHRVRTGVNLIVPRKSIHTPP